MREKKRNKSDTAGMKIMTTNDYQLKYVVTCVKNKKPPKKLLIKAHK